MELGRSGRLKKWMGQIRKIEEEGAKEMKNMSELA